MSGFGKPVRPEVVEVEPGVFVERGVLVLETFVGPRPEGAVVAYLDGDVHNCAVSNLAWSPAP